ncbi:DUF5839 family protein [Lysinibacillus xylanilyticus]|uniref:DUF5839 family protein n=1 Tax=Lysinibacillus xylanilyticus TaxID=582475 RepID=UPI002B2474F4|nr:DUF5839 family protein [Lysinibacillus xylanilyticus]MEB2282916.1 DUF5839 family protein [Lysinibacillus xylanilyticus]
MMQNNNTLSGFHIRSKKDEVLKLQWKQKYTWHIPKHLRDVNIQPGDIVAVGKMFAPVLVTEVFREELEETGKRYKRIKKLLERAPHPKKEPERV